MDTSSVREKIIKLRKEGFSYKQIREKIGASSSYISEVCVSEGINNIGLDKSKRLSKEEITELIEFYETHTKKETSLKFKISTTTVNKYKRSKRKLLSLEEKNQYNFINVKSFRRENKLKAIEYKGGKCSICGYNKNIKALDFHHLNTKDKKFTISHHLYKSWSDLVLELDKCVLICANCHREIH